MCCVILYILVLLVTWLSLSVGLRLYPCAEGYQDVNENSPITFYCDGYTGSTDWRYTSPLRPGTIKISTCPAQTSPTSCESTPDNAWTATWISATNSSLTSTLTSRVHAQPGGEYQCDTEKCGLHVIVPAVVSQPTATITRQDSGYTVSLFANIRQVYSSKGIYSCVWQLGTNRQTPTPVLSPEASNTGNTADRSGSCAVTMPLPSNTGDYSCSVTVSPGNTHKCDTITITPPSPPTISCPTDVIAENTSLTCTCNTNNIGQPGGRLIWYTGFGSDVSTEVISGNYDVNSLSMTWMVSRDDNNVRTFRCVNNWMVNITGQNYTAQVAYPPMETTLLVNDRENEAVTLVCQSRGVPAPRLELLQGETQLARQDGGSLPADRRQLSYRMMTICSNTGNVTCRADDRKGHVQQATMDINVICTRSDTTETSDWFIAFIIVSTIAFVCLVGNCVCLWCWILRRCKQSKRKRPSEKITGTPDDMSPDPGMNPADDDRHYDIVQEGDAEQRTKPPQPPRTSNDNQYQNTKFGATGHTPEPSAASTNSDTGDYGSLNPDDIGLKSVYCDLKQAHISQVAGVDYEIPVPQRPSTISGKK